MKSKYLIWISVAAAVLAACSGGYDDDVFDGSMTYHYYRSGESYMVNLADELVVDNLKAVEDALWYDKEGYYSRADGTEYKTGGKSIWEPSAAWELSSRLEVRGLRMSKSAADSTWTLYRNDKYTLGGNEYPTEYDITVKMEPSWLKDHFNWSVEVRGSRTERKGYACTFWSDGPLYFEAGKDEEWFSCRGTLYMEVTRDGKKVDLSRTDFLGSKSNRKYIRGL